MIVNIGHSGERINPSEFKSTVEYLIYLRHLFAYEHATEVFSKEDIILEIGCGEGYGTSFISKKVKMIVSLDVDLKTLKKAKEKYGPSCNFILYNGTDLPIKSNKFDGVISFQVIEHVQDDSKYILEVYRVLKKCSVFLCTTPNRAYRLEPDQKPWNPFHIREYYAKELERILRNIFCEVKVVGIRGSDEVQAIEIKRVKPRGIHLKIYEKISSIVANNSRGKSKSDNFGEKYFTRDFYITDDANEEGLDLLGICRK
ncbi:MAG TPA: class I SAM-dependent methyltransferase [Methanotrichaceae archaeon]|nr:class I SAM-dependent methyltransferase [Methanotrichaceae archaeon]